MIRKVKEEITDLDRDIMVYSDDDNKEGVLRKVLKSFANNLREAELKINGNKTNYDY